MGIQRIKFCPDKNESVRWRQHRRHGRPIACFQKRFDGWPWSWARSRHERAEKKIHVVADERESDYRK